MKTKLQFLILILFFIVLRTSAQVVPKDILERVNASTYIFEGEVIRTNPYFNANHSFIYTSVTIDIKKTFKGDLSCGTVEMILLGGNVGGKILEVSHSLSLGIGERGIFLAQKNNTREVSSVDFYLETNEVVLQPTMEQQGFVKFNFDEINPEVVDYWQFHLDSIAEAYDLMEFYTQLNYKDCYQPFGHTNHQQRNKNNPENIIPFSTDTILYQTFENPRVVNSGGINYFEFDVAFSDSTSNIYYMGGNCKVKYDTTTFSPRMDLYGKVFVSTGTLLQDNVTYPTIQISDYKRDVLSFTIGWGPWQTTPVNFVDLPTQPIRAFHVLMEIDDCTHPSTIQFVDSPFIAKYNLVQGQSTSPQIGYDDVIGTNSIPFDTCSNIYISSITPNPVTSGTQDTVTISGRGFGASRGSGNIFLKNADDGGSSYIHLNSRDFLANGWSDSLIQFVLPSIVDSVGQNYISAAPGTGQLKVKTSTGDSTSQYINIKYGIMNSIILDTMKMMVHLTPLDTLGNYGEFTFRPDTSISNYPERKICIEAAMKQWRCMTGVNFRLGTDLLVPNDTSSKQDRICRIIVGMTEDTSALAATYQFTLGALGSCNKMFTEEIDVIINRRKIQEFYFDTTTTTSIPANLYDLYSVLIHEFGHGNSLTHINDNSSVMWWQRLPGTPAANRKIKLIDDAEAIEGGNYVTSHSMAIDTVNCPVHRMALGATNCTGLIGISEIENPNINLSVFPNPAVQANINIKYDLETHSRMEILVYDYTGRNVYERQLVHARGTYVEEIPYSIFEKGYYIIHLKINQYDYVGKLIIQ